MGARPAERRLRTPQPPRSPGNSRRYEADLGIAMLQVDEGTTVDEIMAATDSQAHTARGVISGALRKRLGLAVNSEMVEGRGRVYRIGADGRTQRGP